MDFSKYLIISAEQIDKELIDIFKTWRGQIKGVDPRVLKLVEISIRASQGGKRLRGTLVKLGFEMASLGFKREILKVSAAYEIFQTAILAHDDIIDRSPLRRGVPTIYQALGANHYATSQTIVLGDIGFFIAFQMISECHFPDPDKVAAIRAFAKTMIDTAFGEMLDVELSGKKAVKKKDVIEISRYKTAWYTFVGPLTLGASLGGADQKLLSVLKKFGENLGIAYQIQDDILGIFGSEETLGKSVTSDITEGKNTLLITEALKRASNKDRKFLELVYGKAKVTPKEVGEIKEIFIRTGALDYSTRIALEYATKAEKWLSKIKNNKMTKVLEEMVGFLVKRQK